MTSEREKKFLEEYGETLSDLRQVGWDGYGLEPDLKDLQMHLFEMMGEEVKVLARMAARMNSARDDFIYGTASWETGIMPEDRKRARQELLGSCMRLGCSNEFIVDAKLRWDRAEFSSTRGYLVIGDVFVKRPEGCQLREWDEVDLSSPFSEFGRSDLTYQRWEKLRLEDTFPVVRPKINGERFVRVDEGDKSFLMGFKRIQLGKHPGIESVEYYAGRWFVVSPVLASSVECRVLDSGKEMTILFEPHPFMKASSLAAMKSKLFSHQYDGIMVWMEGGEVRAKWRPSAEVEIDGIVWEVCLGDEGLLPLRPRPGKKAVSIATAISQIRSRMRAEFLIPFMEKRISVDVPVTLMAKDANMRIGSKCIFVSRSGQLVMIREESKGKRLDFIGGQLMFGEDPVIGLIREIQEETKVSMVESDFTYLGVSTDEADSVVWMSHVFIAVAPERMLMHHEVERFKISSFSGWWKSNAGRPRQVWVSRHVEFLLDWFKKPNDFLAWDLWKRLANNPQIELKVDPISGDVEYSEKIRPILGQLYLAILQKSSGEDKEGKTISAILGKMKKMAPVDDFAFNWATTQWWQLVRRLLPEVKLPNLPKEMDFKEVMVLPVVKEERYELLQRVFGSNSELGAKEFHQRFSMYKHNARRTVNNWLQDCERMGLIEFVHASTSSDRVIKKL